MINPLAIFVSSLSLDWKQYVAEYVFEDMSAVLSDTYDDDMERRIVDHITDVKKSFYHPLCVVNRLQEKHVLQSSSTGFR